MTFSVVVSESAESDIFSIVEYVANDNPARARKFAAELRIRFTKKLSTFPFSGVAVGPVRYSTFGNYIVVYTVGETAEVVTVVMVSEDHRDWRRLLENLE